MASERARGVPSPVVSSRVVLVAVALACAPGATAFAEDPPASPAEPGAQVARARLHYQAGEKLYLLGRYPDALREFEDGYALAPRPEFLLNLGQVHRRLGDRAAAIAMFEQFLRAIDAADPRRAAVTDLLGELRAEFAATDGAGPPRAPAVTGVAALGTAAPRGRAPASAPWYHDWVGGTLTGAGLASLAVGAGLFVPANATIGDAAVDLDHYRDARDARTPRTVGLTLLGAGGVLVLGGAIRYLTRGP